MSCAVATSPTPLGPLWSERPARSSRTARAPGVSMSSSMRDMKPSRTACASAMLNLDIVSIAAPYASHRACARASSLRSYSHATR